MARGNKYKRAIALLVAEFFYCGRFPIAPGTVGSLASLIIWLPSLYYHWPLWINLLLLVGIFIIGGFCAAYGIEYYQRPDPKQVVIDEVVGQGIAFLVISPNFLDVCLAVIFFRVFDVWKPWPIRAIEHKFQNKWGIMIDDVMAGVFALIVIFIMKAFWQFSY